MLEALKRKLKNYVSKEDQFIHQFDHQHREKSASQKQEIAKYSKIARLRDNIAKTKASTKIWRDF